MGHNSESHPSIARRWARSRLWIASALWLTACGGKQRSEDGETISALFVQVRDQNGAAVPEATLRTDPKTETLVTNAAGTAIFPRLTAGVYQVTAEHEVAGEASEALRVEPAELARLTIELDGVLDPGGGAGGGGGTGASTGSGGTSGAGRGGTAGTSSGGSSGAGQGGDGTGGGPVGTYIDIGTQVEAMLVDPERPYLYALDRVNNSLVFVNLESSEVEKTIFVGSTPVDMDMSDDGSELFIANFGSTEIGIVDLEAQEIGRTIFVDTSQGTWQGNPYRLAVTANGTLAFTSEDQWNNVKLVNAETGVHITAAGSIYQPDLVASPDGTVLYAAESGSTGSAIIRFDVTETTLTEVDKSATAEQYGSRLAVLSGDGRFLFYAKRKILASNLQSILGEYSEIIHASNDDGSLVVGTTNVFDGDTFAVLGPLVVSTQVIAMTADATTVYLYDVNTSRIYVQDLTEF
jgi:hypothetical protein